MKFTVNTRLNPGQHVYNIASCGDIKEWLVTKVDFSGNSDSQAIVISYRLSNSHSPVKYISEHEFDRCGFFESKSDIIKHLASQL